MLFSTLVGLVIKYVLDKKYIFYYRTKTQTENAKKFIFILLYGSIYNFNILCSEILFDKLFEHDMSKYAGAIIGLSIGYSKV